MNNREHDGELGTLRPQSWCKAKACIPVALLSFLGNSTPTPLWYSDRAK